MPPPPMSIILHGARDAQVNRAVAARLLAAQQLQQQAGGTQGSPDEGGQQRGNKGPAATTATPLDDARFAAMFEDEAFAVDEASAEYRALHPNLPARGGERAAAMANEQERLLAEHFEELSEGDDEGDDDDAGSDGSLDDMDERPMQRRQQGHWQALKRQQQPATHHDRGGAGTGRPYTAGAERPRSMYAARHASAAVAFQRGESTSATLSQPLEARMRGASGSTTPRGFIGGSREVTFVPGGRGGSERGGRTRGRGRTGGRGGRPGNGVATPDSGGFHGVGRGGRGGGRGGRARGGRGRGRGRV